MASIWSTSLYYQCKEEKIQFSIKFPKKKKNKKKNSGTEVEKVINNAQIEHC